MFGESAGTLDVGATLKDAGQAKAFNTAMRYLGDRARLSEFYWAMGEREFNRSCNKVRKFARGLVDKALSDCASGCVDGKERNLFLQGLLEETSDLEVLTNHLLSILLAGQDTTASFIGWVYIVLQETPKSCGSSGAKSTSRKGSQDLLPTRTSITPPTYRA